jgi:hypothetical protein
VAQAESITTAVRELMSRGQPPKSTSPRAAHTEFVAAIAGDPPPPIRSDAKAEDLERRADHLQRVFAARRPLDGRHTRRVVEAKFMLPWLFSEEAAAEKQHHTWSYIRFLDLCGFRNRTPSPPPLSSMKSIPAASRARRMAASFASVTGTSPSTTSALRMVATPTFEARAKSRAVHRISARAARIWAVEIFLVEGIDIFYIV